jgi:hypothetical protein
MKQSIRSRTNLPLTALVLFSFVLPLSASVPKDTAAATTNWDNLNQLLVGDKILIKKTNGEKIKGRFAALSDEAISVLRGKKEVGVRKPEVSRVWLQTGDRKGWGAIIGAAAAAPVPLVWVYKATASGPVLTGEDSGLLYLAMAGAGAIGAGVGALVGSRIKKHTLIYKAPPPFPAVGKPRSTLTERNAP